MKSVTSLSGQLPEGVPEDFLPYSITNQLHKKIMRESLFTLRVRARASWRTSARMRIQAIMKKYYPENSYLVGSTPSTQDIQTTITKDYSRVNVMSLIGVFVVCHVEF